MTSRRTLYLTLSLTLPLALMAVLLILTRPIHIAQADPNALHVALGGDCGGASPCYATIQAAVDAASDSDTIIVKTILPVSFKGHSDENSLYSPKTDSMMSDAASSVLSWGILLSRVKYSTSCGGMQ